VLSVDGEKSAELRQQHHRVDETFVPTKNDFRKTGSGTGLTFAGRGSGLTD
jgi:hypothetical protein